MLMVANIGFVFSTLPVQVLLPIIGWRWIFFGTTFLIIVSIVLILLFIPSTKKKFKKDENEIEVKLSDIWKNKFFISVIPLGFFNYGGMYAIQTLWAGPWMIRVTGYSSLESATGLFWINFTALIGFFLWGYFLPKISKCGSITPRFKVKKNEYNYWEQRYLPSFNRGMLLVTTNHGVMSHHEAMNKGLGGFLIGYVY